MAQPEKEAAPSVVKNSLISKPLFGYRYHKAVDLVQLLKGVHDLHSSFFVGLEQDKARARSLRLNLRLAGIKTVPLPALASNLLLLASLKRLGLEAHTEILAHRK